MNYSKPVNWIEMDRTAFSELIEAIYYRERDGWANGILYKSKTGTHFAFDDGDRIWIDPILT